MKKNIFLTGGTGFLGGYLVREILTLTDSNIFLLIRDDKFRAGSVKVQKDIDSHFSKKLADSFKQRLKIVIGDLTKTNFGLADLIFYKLLESIDEIYHVAAKIDLAALQEETKRVNIIGTKNLLDFTARCSHIEKLNYISTVFIAGNYKGDYSEADFYKKQEFNNFYEQSKFEAERLVRDFQKDDINVKIYRPSMIMGEYDTGRSGRESTFNKILKLFYKEFYNIMPLNPDSFYNVIPVDSAARAIVLLALNSENNQTYHITCKQNIRLGHLLNKLSQHLRVKLPRFVSAKNFEKKEKSIVRKFLISPFIPYLNINTIFRSQLTRISLDKVNFIHPVIDIKFFLKNTDICLENKS